MKTISFILFLLLLSALLSNPSNVSSQNQDRPNILFVLTDDQRWDALGCYGNHSLKTPNIDKLAGGGSRFEFFYAASPLCCPNRAVLLTGLYPHQTGIIANRGDIPPGLPTIAEKLNESGYVTGFIGKAHLGGDPRKWGFKESPVYFPGGALRYDADSHKNPILNVHGKETKVQGQITQIFADAAIEFLETHKSDLWFLWLATTVPHQPYFKDPKHLYSSSAIKPPPGWPQGQGFKPSIGAKWTDYYSTISMLDDQIGRILEKLNTLGLSQNTVVFYTSDNGDMFGSHGLSGKEVWDEESVRGPAMMRWPGKIPPRTTVRSLASSIDFFPTVLDLAKVKIPVSGLEGSSMLPALMGGKSNRTAVFSEVEDKKHDAGGYWQMIRSDELKYVRLKNGKEYLYDLKNDPSELKDLSQATQYQTSIQQMRKQMDQWLSQTPVRLPTQPKKAS